jgi:hypothetical protein
MRIILALIAVVALVGCGGPGDTPGPSDPNGKAANNAAADDTINNIPPEFRERAKELREKGMQNSGPPPGAKK